MNILQLAAVRGRGGTGASVATLSLALKKAGHKVWMACYSKSSTRKRLEGTGVEVLTDIKMSSSFNPIKMAWDLVKITRLVKKQNIDVIHAHSSPDGRLALLVKLINPGIIFIRSRHIPLPIKDKLQSRFVDVALASSFAVKGKMNFSWIEKTRVFYDAFDPAEKLKRKPHIVKNISRYAKVKGLFFFADAFRLVSDKVKVKAEIVGRIKDEKLFEKLRLFIESYGLDRNLSDVTESLRYLYGDALLICLTSIDSEGSSRVAIEAMHVGIPVLAHRVGAVDEIVADGKTGVTIKPGDTKELAKVMIFLLLNPCLRRIMEANAKRASRRFSIERMQKQYEELVLTLQESHR